MSHDIPNASAQHTFAVLNDLCDISQTIGGGINGCNSAYQILLAVRVDHAVQQSGKAIRDLTVGELIAIIGDCKAEYNARATA